ncbi:winged helix-turn-helix domain-containing protein [Salmonella enterica subsp. arizonae serovar 13,23:gz51:-]|nr:winged helix-turn-helix domain-containing protein [Salmonella enterica subsp. arizonae serovar 13,23:gz51:-]
MISEEKRQQILTAIESFGASGATVKQLSEKIHIGTSGTASYVCRLRRDGYIIEIGKVPTRSTPIYVVNNGKYQPEGPDIFEQCRANWQGYQIHKIFGSASRHTA